MYNTNIYFSSSVSRVDTRAIISTAVDVVVALHNISNNIYKTALLSSIMTGVLSYASTTHLSFFLFKAVCAVILLPSLFPSIIAASHMQQYRLVVQK